jgi:hypothetical protein
VVPLELPCLPISAFSPLLVNPSPCPCCALAGLFSVLWGGWLLVAQGPSSPVVALLCVLFSLFLCCSSCLWLCSKLVPGVAGCWYQLTPCSGLLHCCLDLVLVCWVVVASVSFLVQPVLVPIGPFMLCCHSLV